jgi:hypothetical protein
MTLILNSLPYRWRGRYNEDTDICLRALKDGWVTCQFNAFLGDKLSTLTCKGGNTDTIYNTGDHRRAFAESLREQHPDVVRVTWKFGRWHHQVDYSPFRKNRAIMRADITPTAEPDEFGMQLCRRPKYAALQEKIDDDAAALVERADVNAERGEGLDAERESSSDAPPMSDCPNCGQSQIDMDGFGVLRCESCGYCAHPSRTGNVCDICGDVESEDDADESKNQADAAYLAPSHDKPEIPTPTPESSGGLFGSGGFSMIGG